MKRVVKKKVYFYSFQGRVTYAYYVARVLDPHCPLSDMRAGLTQERPDRTGLAGLFRSVVSSILASAEAGIAAASTEALLISLSSSISRLSVYN